MTFPKPDYLLKAPTCKNHHFGVKASAPEFGEGEHKHSSLT